MGRSGRLRFLRRLFLSAFRLVDPPSLQRLDHLLVRKIVLDGRNGDILLADCGLIIFEISIDFFETAGEPIILPIVRIASMIERIIPDRLALPRDQDPGGTLIFKRVPEGNPFAMTFSATIRATFAAYRKSAGAYVVSDTAIDGMPRIVPSVAAETVPE
jgi:hypothetical protein